MEYLASICSLLVNSGLGVDSDILLFVEVWAGETLVDCAGLAQGKNIDVLLVTDLGIAVNSVPSEIRNQLIAAGLKVVDVEILYDWAVSLTGLLIKLSV
ncbi:hypothetical protein CYG68_19350 [Morganella morganii]|uniref:Uncharacterized protein n=1 Tax=Morganella morganii TaxID=582 RepID=A0A8I0PZE7_MORMO|nr:hypothetical protein [Morganella morganii]